MQPISINTNITFLTLELIDFFIQPYDENCLNLINCYVKTIFWPWQVLVRNGVRKRCNIPQGTFTTFGCIDRYDLQIRWAIQRSSTPAKNAYDLRSSNRINLWHDDRYHNKYTVRNVYTMCTPFDVWEKSPIPFQYSDHIGFYCWPFLATLCFRSGTDSRYEWCNDAKKGVINTTGKWFSYGILSSFPRPIICHLSQFPLYLVYRP